MKHARADYQERVQDSAGIIPEDEPVFLLRAQDTTAAETVRSWAERNERLFGPSMGTQAARIQADKMERWHTRKAPDCTHEQLFGAKAEHFPTEEQLTMNDPDWPAERRPLSDVTLEEAEAEALEPTED